MNIRLHVFLSDFFPRKKKQNGRTSRWLCPLLIVSPHLGERRRSANTWGRFAPASWVTEVAIIYPDIIFVYIVYHISYIHDHIFTKLDKILQFGGRFVKLRHAPERPFEC